MTTNPLALPNALEQLLIKIIAINGTIVPQRSILNFLGTITWADNAANDSTDVTLSGGGGGGFVAGGDLTGSASSQEVIGLLAHTLPSLAPGYLNWTGLAWAFSSLPSSLPPSGPAGGDLANAYPNPEVVGLLAHALPSLSPGFLEWTGSAWAFATLAALLSWGTPVAAASSLTMTGSTGRWILIQPGESITLPVVGQLTTGLEYMFTTTGHGYSAGSPVTFASPGGYLIQDPQDPNNISGSNPAAGSVEGFGENTTYRGAYDGGGVFRWV